MVAMVAHVALVAVEKSFDVKELLETFILLMHLLALKLKEDILINKYEQSR